MFEFLIVGKALAAKLAHQVSNTRMCTGLTLQQYTSDLMPHIGGVPGRANQFICAGFNGHGMPLILLATKGVAKMIRDNCLFEDTGIPGAFKTTEERLKSKENAILDSEPQ